jgi:hypothetical protein
MVRGGREVKELAAGRRVQNPHRALRRRLPRSACSCEFQGRVWGPS